jgi:hypothetical protein
MPLRELGVSLEVLGFSGVRLRYGDRLNFTSDTDDE